MFWGCHTLVPVINSIFLQAVWVPLSQYVNLYVCNIKFLLITMLNTDNIIIVSLLASETLLKNTQS